MSQSNPPQDSKPEPHHDGNFELYDLQISVEAIEGNCTCKMSVGDCFFLRSGKLSMPADKDFCVYALQSTLPLLPAKQRRNHPADWMETDSRVSCPDPACRLIMRIDRIDTRALHHDQVSAIPWESLQADAGETPSAEPSATEPSADGPSAAGPSAAGTEG